MNKSDHIKENIAWSTQELIDATQTSLCMTKTKNRRKKNTPASRNTSHEHGNSTNSTREYEAICNNVNVEMRS